MRFLLILSVLFTAVLSLSSPCFAAIDFTVTPIKYELNLNPGETITLPASIRNNGNTTVTLPTAASDFQASGKDGTPNFVRKSELVYPDQQLSNWIEIQDESLTLAPGEEKTTRFTIRVPSTATPGGHYGGIFFKNNNSENSGEGNISINVDYGILILVNVSGEVVVDVDIGKVIISGGGTIKRDICEGEDTSGDIFDGSCGDGIHDLNQVTKKISSLITRKDSHDSAWYVGTDEQGKAIYEFPDNCLFGDFTSSKYDGKCFDYGKEIKEKTLNISENIKTNFVIDFTLPVMNKGNTHVKPEGKIILKDENNEIIKGVGKISITNDQGAVIGEQIVDYIPINDEGGNVLPNSERDFSSQWKGFPYKDYDENGNPIIKYWTPGEYYSQKLKNSIGFLMPWQRISEVRQDKKITSEIEIEYYDEKGNPIHFSSAEEFPIQYIEQRVTTNPYIILAGILSLLLGSIVYALHRWKIVRNTIKKCWNCKKKIKSDWETCPYCKALQNKKENQKFQNMIHEKSEEKNEKPLKKENSRKEEKIKIKPTEKENRAKSQKTGPENWRKKKAPNSEKAGEQTQQIELPAPISEAPKKRGRPKKQTQEEVSPRVNPDTKKRGRPRKENI